MPSYCQFQADPAEAFEAEAFLGSLTDAEHREFAAILRDDRRIASDWLQDHGCRITHHVFLPEDVVPAWLHAWRRGFLPLYSEVQLRHMLHGLETEDRNVLQGATCTPPPLQVVMDWPVEACDLTSYGFWMEGGTETTVAEVEEFFARTCFEADNLLGEPAGCRHWLNWYDEIPRDEMRDCMVREIRLDLEALFPETVGV